MVIRTVLAAGVNFTFYIDTLLIDCMRWRSDQYIGLSQYEQCCLESPLKVGQLFFGGGTCWAPNIVMNMGEGGSKQLIAAFHCAHPKASSSYPMVHWAIAPFKGRMSGFICWIWGFGVTKQQHYCHMALCLAFWV